MWCVIWCVIWCGRGGCGMACSRYGWSDLVWSGMRRWGSFSSLFVTCYEICQMRILAARDF